MLGAGFPGASTSGALKAASSARPAPAGTAARQGSSAAAAAAAAEPAAWRWKLTSHSRRTASGTKSKSDLWLPTAFLSSQQASLRWRHRRAA